MLSGTQPNQSDDMKVLFINPEFPAGESVWTPLGTAYVASYLEKNGVSVQILDNAVTRYNKDELKKYIEQYSPDVVCTGGKTLQAESAFLIADAAKEVSRSIFVVYGGVHFTFMPDDGLQHDGDVVVIGEGERTLLELIEKIGNGGDWKSIKGIAYSDSGKTVLTEERAFIENMDEIPAPARHLLPMGKYSDVLMDGTKAFSIMTGKGCPFNCVFCASPQIYKRKMRFWSVSRVMAEIDELVNKYHAKALWFVDDTFAANRQRVHDICDAIIERGYRLKMSCLTRVDTADLEMFRKMKRAGFRIVEFGIESGDENILKLVNKQIDLQKARDAVKIAHKAGLEVELLFMIGNIGENEQTIMNTIKLARELDAEYYWFQFATPFVGSKFHEIAKQYGAVLDKSWKDYNHQDIVFVPNGLTRERMMELRELALRETRRTPAKIKKSIRALPETAYKTIKLKLGRGNG